MKKHLSIALIILILVIFTISGYVAKQDINDMAYVVAIGIDVRRKERLKGKFSAFYSFQKFFE